MDSKEVLTIQHWKEVGPGSVLYLFGIVKEDADPLVILLRQKWIEIVDELLQIVKTYFRAMLEQLIGSMEHNPSIHLFL